MAQEQARSVSTPLSDTLVVDCDVHPAYNTPELAEKKAKYMDDIYAERLLATSEQSDSRNTYSSGPFPVNSPGKDTMNHVVRDPQEDVQEALCDEFGVDHPILNSILRFDIVPEADRAVQEMRAENNLMLEHWLDDHEDFFGLCRVTTRRPDKAAEELDRLGDEKQIVGVQFLDGGTEKPLGDPRYDQIYQAAEDNDLAVAYHSGTDINFLSRNFPVLAHDMEKLVSIHALVHPFAHMLTMTSLLIQGVPVKFPDLNFVFVEASIGWIPYMMGRLNREYAQRSWDAPLLEQTPEEYVRDRFYFSTQPLEEPNDPEHVRQLIDMVGPESLVFSTDFPHFDFDNPSGIMKLLSHLSREERERILHGNAIEAYDLPL